MSAWDDEAGYERGDPKHPDAARAGSGMSPVAEPRRFERSPGSTWDDAWMRREVPHSALRITPQALEVATPEQWQAIKRLLERGDLRVMVDFTVGSDNTWLAWHNGDASLYGGISPEGSVHT